MHQTLQALAREPKPFRKAQRESFDTPMHALERDEASR